MIYLTLFKLVIGPILFATHILAYRNVTDELGSCVSDAAHADQPSVEVNNGTIFGIHSAAYAQDFFLGIPFAQPPVNDLRFENPQSLNTTYNGGVLNATEYAPACIGYGAGESELPLSEDCLYLNIVRPSGHDNVSLPVAVWIHGGVSQLVAPVFRATILALSWRTRSKLENPS